MSSKKVTLKQKRAFTLLELIIVVLILSLMSFMLFSTMSGKEKKKKQVLTLTTLPNTFRQAFKGKGEVELFCVNQCKTCYLLMDGKITPYEGAIDFGEEVQVHILDSDNRFQKVDNFGRIKDQKVCLRYHLYANGSTTQMVVENSHGFYYLPSFFGKVQEINDTEEAKALWIKEEYSLHDSGSFY